ncbi:MAG TPA: hypothetical protein VJT69_20220 [Pyrinomonadaceae bacterium]|nr:hypothetical protein [Pyrinomonadaceae bacterium]
MSPHYKRFILLVFTVMLAAARPHQIASAAPSLKTEDELKFTFPLPDTSHNTFSFLLFSTEGDVARVSPQVRQIKTPDGIPLPLEAVRAEMETTTVSPKGVKVSITLEPKFFVAPGDYRVILFFQSETGSPNLSSTILINRPAADINIDELKDQTVALTRLLPFLPTGSDFLLHIRENTGKVQLNDLKVEGQSIYVKDTKELVPGNVAPENQQAINLGPGAVKTLKVTLSNLQYAGTFDTRLLVTSPSFSGGKVIPLKITVQDFVLFPLLAIALGVYGGYKTRRLVAVEKPRNLNSLELLRIQNEVERFRETVRKPASIDTIESLFAQLIKAQESNDTGDFAAVREELPKLRDKLAEFRKAQVQAEGEAQTAFSSLLNQVDVLEQSSTLTTDESRDLHSIKDKLDDIDRLLRLGMVEDAQMKIENVKQLLGDLRARKFANYFTELKLELSKLTLSATDQTTSETLKAEIQTLLNSSQLDKVRLKLEELKSFIEEQKQRTAGRGARANEADFAELPEVPAALPAAALFTRISIATAPADRIAGETIDFNLIDDEKIVQDGDELRWFFGDVGSFEIRDRNALHRYERSGRYPVRVEVVRDKKIVKTVREKLTIAPGEIEEARAGIIQDIIRNEKILSLIALLLAIIGGVLFLYSGKLFGTLVDYLMAILWGFGLDNSIKGFAAVLGKISST